MCACRTYIYTHKAQWPFWLRQVVIRVVLGSTTQQQYRQQTHFVDGVDDHGPIPGLRSTADVIVYVDVRRYMRDGGLCWWSRQGVLLIEGMKVDGENIGVQPKYFLAITHRYSGEPFVPLPTPERTPQLGIVDAEVVAEGIITTEEADRVQRQVAFSFEEEAEISGRDMRRR